MNIKRHVHKFQIENYTIYGPFVLNLYAILSELCNKLLRAYWVVKILHFKLAVFKFSIVANPGSLSVDLKQRSIRFKSASCNED